MKWEKTVFKNINYTVSTRQLLITKTLEFGQAYKQNFKIMSAPPASYYEGHQVFCHHCVVTYDRVAP